VKKKALSREQPVAREWVRECTAPAPSRRPGWFAPLDGRSVPHHGPCGRSPRGPASHRL